MCEGSATPLADSITGDAAVDCPPLHAAVKAYYSQLPLTHKLSLHKFVRSLSGTLRIGSACSGAATHVNLQHRCVRRAAVCGLSEAMFSLPRLCRRCCHHRRLMLRPMMPPSSCPNASAAGAAAAAAADSAAAVAPYTPVANSRWCYGCRCILLVLMLPPVADCVVKYYICAVAAVIPGTDLVFICTRLLLDECFALFDTRCTVSEAFSVEKDKGKQRFIMKHHGSCRMLIADTKDLGQARALNVKNNEIELIPGGLDVFCAGFSCKSRSSLNAHSSANLFCVQQQFGETGQTWKDCHDYITRATPRLIVLENVGNLESGGSSAALSDADHIIQQLAAAKYASRWVHVEALDHGSVARRDRIYLVGLLSGTCTEFDHMSAALVDLESILSSLHLPAFPLTSFIDVAVADPSSLKPTSTEKAPNAKCWDDHKAIYEDHGLPYPPDMSRCDPAVLPLLQGLTERAKEVVMFMCTQYPTTCADGLTLQAIDYNFSLARVKRGWTTNCLPTMVGSSKAIVSDVLLRWLVRLMVLLLLLRRTLTPSLLLWLLLLLLLRMSSPVRWLIWLDVGSCCHRCCLLMLPPLVLPTHCRAAVVAVLAIVPCHHVITFRYLFSSSCAT